MLSVPGKKVDCGFPVGLLKQPSWKLVLSLGHSFQSDGMMTLVAGCWWRNTPEEWLSEGGGSDSLQSRGEHQDSWPLPDWEALDHLFTATGSDALT